MYMEETLKRELEDLYQMFFHHPKVAYMKEYYIHRGTSCFIHSFKVAKLAIKMAIKKGLKELKTLLIASILHDYYLYNRKEIKKKKHGREHPFISSSNAKRDFDVSDDVVDIINSHMWPLNFKYFPKTKEAKTLSKADKIIAIKEFLTSKNKKNKNLDKDMKYISYLF